MTVKVEATLRDRVTDFTRTYEEEIDSKYTSSQRFLWEEGNYRCDCNRSLFLWKWGELWPSGWPRDELDAFGSLGCGEKRIELLSLKVDGQEILAECEI